MKKSFTKICYAVQDYAVILLGLILYAFGFNAFILSNGIVPGGLTGVSSLIFYSTGVPVYLSYFVLNAILLAAGFKILGFRFLLKTLFGVGILTLLLRFFQNLITEPLLPNDPLLSIVIGAFMLGGGLGLSFLGNGSTGGTDIIAAIVNKYRHISIGRIMLLCDLIIISSSYFIFHSIEKIVYALVIMVIMSLVIDMILNGSRQSYQYFIYSKEYEKIADSIIKDLDRGCTVLDGTGWYSKNEVKVVVVVAKKTESRSVFRLVKNIDERAFITQASVMGVYGEGFEPIKA